MVVDEKASESKCSASEGNPFLRNDAVKTDFRIE